MRKPLLCLFLSIFLFVVSGCSDEGRPETSKLAQPPSSVTGGAGGVKPVQAVAPIPTPMDTFRALAPPEGLKFTPLFAEPLKDEDARIKRLEDQVQLLRNDFDTVVPSLVRLVAVEKDMKELVGQLQTLTNQGANNVEAKQLPPPAPPVANAPTPVATNPPPPAPTVPATAEGKPVPGAEAAAKAVPAAPVTPEAASVGNEAKVASSPPAGAASPSPEAPKLLQPMTSLQGTPENKNPAPSAGDIKGLRFGDHPGVTRVVLDMAHQQDVTVTLAPGGRQLVIDLQGSGFGGKPGGKGQGSTLVAGYALTDGKLVINLTAPCRIKARKLLTPGDPLVHYFIDLEKAP